MFEFFSRWYFAFEEMALFVLFFYVYFLFSTRNEMLLFAMFAHDELTLILFVFFARIPRRQRLQRLI